MSNILYMAISSDGFIAGVNDETPWSDEEWVAFQSFVKSCDVVLLGRRTFEIMKNSGEFVKGAHYLVVTSHALDEEDIPTLTIKHSSDMPESSKIGIIGGGELNGRLAEIGVIDEVILDVEAIDLEHGMKLYGNHNIELPLELISSQKLGETTTQKHYRVVK